MSYLWIPLLSASGAMVLVLVRDHKKLLEDLKQVSAIFIQKPRIIIVFSKLINQHNFISTQKSCIIFLSLACLHDYSFSALFVNKSWISCRCQVGYDEHPTLLSSWKHQKSSFTGSTSTGIVVCTYGTNSFFKWVVLFHCSCPQGFGTCLLSGLIKVFIIISYELIRNKSSRNFGIFRTF